MIHIEFIGISGAGKSLLRRRLNHQLDALGIRHYHIEQVRQQAYANWSSLGTFAVIKNWLRAPLSSWNDYHRRKHQCLPDRFSAWQQFMDTYPEMAAHLAMGFAAARGAPSSIRVGYTILLHLCSHFQAARHAFGEHDALLLDEGFFHQQVELATLSDSPTARELLMESLRAGPTPNLLIWVDVPAELADRRKSMPIFRARTMRDLTHRDRLTMLDKWSSYISTTISQLDEQVNIIHIQNDGELLDVDDRLKAVASFVSRYVRDNGTSEVCHATPKPTVSMR